MSKEKRQYITPSAEVIDLGCGESVLNVDGTHSVDGYQESEWTNVGEEGEDDDIIMSNHSGLWD
ncbi:MAG: hypothetical protein IKH02_03200 [Prevotella sp.]|nr:hypothetical protein [Prevotella sp.]